MKQTYRVLAMTIALVLVLLCTSCTHGFDFPSPHDAPTTSNGGFTTTTAPQDDVKSDPPLALIDLRDSRYFYEGLPESFRLHYDQIVEELYRYSGVESILEDHTPGIRIYLKNAAALGTDDVFEIVDAVYDDHPELFYLHPDYLVMANGNYAYVDIPYFMDLSERQQAAAALRGYVLKTAAQAGTRDDFRKAVFIHDKLLLECNYNHEAAENLDNRSLYAENCSAYSALCRDEAVCVGYTRAMQLFLSYFDIPNTVVYNDDHVWNLVWFDGEPYHIDATWDDIDGIFCHTYFGLTTAEIRKTRDIPAQARPLPSATATVYNYYNYTDKYFDGLSDAFFDSFGVQMDNNANLSREGEYYAEARFTADGYAQAIDAITDGELSHMMAYFLTDPYEENDYIYKRMRAYQYYSYPELHIIVFQTNNEILESIDG